MVSGFPAVTIDRLLPSAVLKEAQERACVTDKTHGLPVMCEVPLIRIPNGPEQFWQRTLYVTENIP